MKLNSTLTLVSLLAASSLLMASEQAATPNSPVIVNRADYAQLIHETLIQHITLAASINQSLNEISHTGKVSSACKAKLTSEAAKDHEIQLKAIAAFHKAKELNLLSISEIIRHHKKLEKDLILSNENREFCNNLKETQPNSCIIL